MTLEKYFKDWFKVIPIKELKRILAILTTLYKNKQISPKYSNVFRAFSLCEYNELKVVFLGNEPYYNNANGILYGRDDSYLSSSLNSLQEYVIDYTRDIKCVKFDNTLESWCKQGVLMLNCSLTVEINKKGSHRYLWHNFIKYLLTNLSLYNPGIIYVVCDEYAKEFLPYIKHNSIIIDKLDKNTFKLLNKLLIGKYGDTIKWFNDLNDCL